MKVGDIYPTRDGRKARVIKINDWVEDNTAVIEIVQPQQTYNIFVDTGRANYPGNGDRPYDLILPPKTSRAQRVIEYEGSEEWVNTMMDTTHNVCGPERSPKLGDGIIREVSRKFL